MYIHSRLCSHLAGQILERLTYGLDGARGQDRAAAPV